MARGKGVNYGVSGAIALTTGSFSGNASAFQIAPNNRKKSRVGRGSGLYARWRMALLGGQLVVTANVRGDVPPSPNMVRNETGTVVLTFDTGKTCSVPIKVTDHPALVANTKTSDQWQVTFTCDLTGEPQWAGFGTKTSGTEDFADQEIYEGKLTTVDPDYLMDGAVVNVDCVGVTASDQAEMAKMWALLTAWAATSPIPGLKIRTVAMVSRDPFGITIQITFARTTTAEDVENEGTFTVYDPDNLVTSGQVTKVRSTPTAPSGQVVRDITTRELNDGALVKTAKTGLEGHEDELERTNSGSVFDPEYLIAQKEYATLELVQPATPPPGDGTVLHSIVPQRQANGETLWVFQYRTRSSKQEIEFESVTRLDPATMESAANIIAVQAVDASVPPSTPFPNALITDTDRKQLSAAAGKERWLYTYQFGYETNDMREERLATSEHLGDWSARASTAEMDGVPSAHPTLVETGRDVRRYPNGHVLNIKQHGLETDPQHWMRVGTTTTTDVSDLESDGKVSTIGAPGTPPAGQVIVATTVVRHVDGTYGYTLTTGLETNAQRETRLRTSEHLGDWSAHATTAAFDSVPGAHLTLVEKAQETYPLPHGHAVNVKVHALETDPQNWVRVGTSTTTDVSDLTSEGRVSNIGSPASPPPGQVVVATTVVRHVDGTYGYTITTGLETNAQREVRLATSEHLGDWSANATTAAFDSVAGAHLTLVETGRDVKFLPHGHVVNIKRHGLETDPQHWMRVGSSTTTDVSDLESQGTVANIGSPASPPAGQVVVATTVVRHIDGTYGYTITTGLETNAQREVRLATSEHLGDWSANATTAAFDSVAGAHLTLVETGHDVKLLPHGHVVNIKRHGLETDPNKWKRENTSTTTDPGDLESHGKVAEINNLPTAPIGFKSVGLTMVRLIDGTTGYIMETGLETSAEREVRISKNEYIDVDGIDSKAATAAMDVAATPHAFLVPIGDTHKYLPNGHVVNIKEHAVETNLQRIVREHTTETLGGWSPEAKTCAIDALPAPHQTLVQRTMTKRRLANGRYAWIADYGIETDPARWTRENTSTSTDVSGMESHGRVAQIGAIPNPPAGQKQISVTVATMPDGTVGYIIDTGLETPAERWVREHTSATIDVDGIGSEATTAAIDGAAPGCPYPGLLKAFDRPIRLPGNHIGNVAGYDVWGGDSAKIVGRAQRSNINQRRYAEWDTAEEVDLNGSLENTMEAIFASLQGNVEFNGLAGELLSPGKALVIKSYSKGEKILLANFSGEMTWANTRNGAVAVVLSRPFSDTWSYIRTQRSLVYKVTGTIVYRRRFAVSDWTTKLYPASIGYRNQGVLLGQSPGYLQYQGASIASDEYIAGNKLIEVDYRLGYDSTLFCEDGAVGIGDFTVPWVGPTGYRAPWTLDSGWVVAYPGYADLSFVWS